MAHLTYKHRIIFEHCDKKGYSRRATAAEANCAPSTVCEEMKRCPPGAYNADDAQRDAESKWSAARSRPRKFHGALWDGILRDIAEHRSVIIAAHKNKVSVQGIYKRFEKNRKENMAKLVSFAKQVGNPLPSKAFFRHGGANAYRRRRKALTPFCGGDYATIHARPPGVAKLRRYGHWEVDLIVSSHGDAILSLVEMKSETLILARPSSRKADDVAEAIVSALRRCKRKVLSITSDRGGEFCRWRRVAEALSCPWYMCDAGNPCQRGRNEQKNGMVRWLIRRNVAWSQVPDSMLRDVEDFLNNRPQPSRNFRTAREMFPM